MMIFNLDKSFDRYLLIQMAELAKQYKEPYDSHDEPAKRNNAPLEQKMKFFNELLTAKINKEF